MVFEKNEECKWLLVEESTASGTTGVIDEAQKKDPTYDLAIKKSLLRAISTKR